MLVGVVFIVGGIEILAAGVREGLGHILRLAHEEVSEGVVLIHVTRVLEGSG